MIRMIRKEASGWWPKKRARMSIREKSFREGFRARLRGENITANPHPLSSEAWANWQAGWRDQDEHLRDRDEALASIGWFG